jgi:pilus assembly protein CpaF
MTLLSIDPIAEQSPLGGLERWLHDPSVSEVIVNGGSEVWVERDGHLQLVGRMRVDTVMMALERILAPIGRRLDRSHPSVDARLADGSRLCAAIPPIAVDGPCVAIRRFATRPIALDQFGAPPVAAVLRDTVARRCNVLVSGATSAGKTTLLNALAQLASPHERLITLEDVAELRLPHPHVVRLETRDPTPDGVDGVDLAQLLRTALRLRPDRLVVGEIRGREAMHLLQALNTGHDGSLATVHANSALDALMRVSTLVLQSAASWPWAAVQHTVARAIDVVVHVTRSDDGRRTVHEIVEVVEPHGSSNPTAAQLRVIPVVRRGEVVGELSHART